MFLRFISVALLGLPLIGSAHAQTGVPTAASDPVLVFNRVCYAQVPVLDNIREMSTRFAWEQIGGEDLKQFTTVETPAVLEGWDVRIAQRLYRLGIVQTEVAGPFKENFPDFSGGTVTGCSLVLDGSDRADIVSERMTTLARKEPVSVDVPDGDLLTTTWAGGNEDFKVFLFQKSDPADKATLLNVTILSREKTLRQNLAFNMQLKMAARPAISLQTTAHRRKLVHVHSD